MSWHRPPAKAVVLSKHELLCTRHQLASALSVHPDTVKRNWQPWACDVITRAVLYYFHDGTDDHDERVAC